MSDVDVMAALVLQHSTARVQDRWGDWKSHYVTESSAKKSAEALYAAGFRLTVDDTDRTQNSRLDELERRLVRLEGWAGLPL
ncbi:Uncharacterised protein [Mycobacteroides abscessus subsp. abscessus]|uniref:Uncharacterized protein n=1 Tax=Mycobacteroides abscessus subsp. abscessus TaxID=1185650 RepID=A0AB38D0Z4_9MYCO|nr:hypothetical protein [Mycobacteroides abscessus]OHU63976.1 hypothetical protein BKG85_11105 [Mycobacteroides chelonae]SHX05712.1 Uncharacterised protein [Mycobacteroides abscessus subsp. abscessus]SIA12904.1 Uncharacterised protein [Mycobacteroides abscessus subsp. abscessus]SIB13747.1 Uncharacterised protein [Mycobacteroides abscessus subsp. abscessus]SIB15060.1 Uncharacterised protein [Mycobacteroides abscessus subsp. abscessus]